MLTFTEPVFFGKLIKRYKRFLIDITLDDDNTIITAHSPNTGSMLGLLHPNSRILTTRSSNPKRACPFTVQAIEVDGEMVGINTLAPNRLIKASLKHPLLDELTHYRSMKSEQSYGQDLRSRVDFYFSDSPIEPPLFLEIKSVTLKIDDDAQFPDAVSTRALKHLHDLMTVIDDGARAALWFIVQRQDCKTFRPAAHIDEIYARELVRAQQHGLRIRALCARIDEHGIKLTHEIPCIL